MRPKKMTVNCDFNETQSAQLHGIQQYMCGVETRSSCVKLTFSLEFDRTIRTLPLSRAMFQVVKKVICRFVLLQSADLPLF